MAFFPRARRHGHMPFCRRSHLCPPRHLHRHIRTPVDRSPLSLSLLCPLPPPSPRTALLLHPNTTLLLPARKRGDQVVSSACEARRRAAARLGPKRVRHRRTASPLPSIPSGPASPSPQYSDGTHANALDYELKGRILSVNCAQGPFFDQIALVIFLSCCSCLAHATSGPRGQDISSSNAKLQNVPLCGGSGGAA